MLRDEAIESLGLALAKAYRHGVLLGAEVDLRDVSSVEDALAVQQAAVGALNAQHLGYALAATTSQTARLLGSDTPIVGPILAERVVPSGSSLRLGPAVIGVGAQLAFIFGRTPDRTDLATGLSLADAIASCHLGLQVLGRRVPHSVRLDLNTGLADLGLTEAFVHGPRLADWRERLAAGINVTMRLDGHDCGHGRIGFLSLDPLLWLVEALRTGYPVVEAGDIVTTGSLTGLLQVRPGQSAAGDFGSSGTVEVHFC